MSSLRVYRRPSFLVYVLHLSPSVNGGVMAQEELDREMAQLIERTQNINWNEDFRVLSINGH